MIESVDFEEENYFYPDECFDRNTSKLMLENIFWHSPSNMKLTDVVVF
jgi:hypothetical protein